VELRAPTARLAAALAALLLVLAAAAGRASAQDLKFPPSQDKPPKGYVLTAKKVIRIADRQPKVIAERRKRGSLQPAAYTKGPGRWQVSYFQGRIERAQVAVDDNTGWVLEAWTGPQVAWRMARGEPGAFAGKLNAPYLWIPLCVLFLVPFVDRRRPFRILHLDLLVLLAFGVSHIFFNRGEISTSVPLAYPVLLYVLARMLWIGFRPREKRQRLVPHVPVVWLALALVFLVGFRVALNVADSSVIDVGYAGVIGADRIVHGKGLYGDRSFARDNEHGDTYGPVNYLVYVPFREVFGFDGTWADLPAAHAAAIAFDLLTLLGLLVLGRRLRAGPAAQRPGRSPRAGPGGWGLGVALAYAWAAYPYTLFALDCNSNDSLVAMVLVWALVALRSAPARGLLLGLGAAAKFAPLALVPLFATSGSRHRWRGALVVALAVALVAVAAFAPFVPDGGLRAVYDRTLGYQAGRPSPFSIWGQHLGLSDVWTAAKVLVVALAVAVAFVPRNKTPVQVAALGAAVLVALELVVSHWFYLYVVWFAPFVLVALFALYRGEDGGPEEAAEAVAHEPRPAQPALA
jgi:glycosyl transferase family 87